MMQFCNFFFIWFRNHEGKTLVINLLLQNVTTLIDETIDEN